MRLDNFNPQKNLVLRSVLYAIGLGGLLHFLVLLVVAIRQHNLVWFNPLFAIDLEKIWPGLVNSYPTFIGGWAFLAVSSWVIYRLIRRS